jgi:HemY protein
MRRVISFLVVAAILVAFAWWMAELPGSVSVNVGTINMSAPTPVALLAALVLFLVVYIIVRLLALVFRLPSRTRRLRAMRNRDRGDTAVTRTLLALAGGDPDTARREAQRSRALLGDTPHTLLLSAYAARQGGEAERADAVFTELAGRKDAAFLGLRGLYQGAVARGDWDAANALARQAADINPDAPWLRTERERLAIRSGSWTEALQLAGRGTPVAVLATAAAEAEPDPAQARRLAQRAWKADPAFTPAALAYARRLREAGREKRAQAVLRESWTKNPHPALGEASMAVGGFMSRESRAVWLTTDLPDHPESKLLRAHAALDAGNLVEARRYAEAARDGGLEERRVWLLLAGIATREDDAEAASSALRRAANAPPDAHWRCEACGESHEEWHAVCSHCGEAGKITWGSQVGRGTTTLAIDSGYAILP